MCPEKNIYKNGIIYVLKFGITWLIGPSEKIHYKRLIVLTGAMGNIFRIFASEYGERLDVRNIVFLTAR